MFSLHLPFHQRTASKTERDKALELPNRNCRFGRDIGIPIMMNFVMVFGWVQALGGKER